MGLQSGIRPIVVVPGRGKQDGLARTVKLAIDGVEAAATGKTPEAATAAAV